MAIKVKWDVDGKGEEAWGGSGTRYEGKPPPKGVYIAKIKRITMSKIKSEANKGKPRLNVLLEVVGGQGADGLNDEDYQYLNAPIWDGVNVIKSQAGRANMFVHALTDGSDDAKREVENAFWPPHMNVKAERVAKRNGDEEVHIKSIGKYQINSPNGNILVKVVTKMGRALDGSPRAEVAQYLPYQPKSGVKTNGATVDAGEDSDDDEDDEMLDVADMPDDDDDDDDAGDEDFEDGEVDDPEERVF